MIKWIKIDVILKVLFSIFSIKYADVTKTGRHLKGKLV